ncbi:ubiquinone biosynthesis hydroxylase, UbiH/UbiF/VisC/COQ6 family, partial [Methylorubrum extorquens DSM 13060]
MTVPVQTSPARPSAAPPRFTVAVVGAGAAGLAAAL